MRRSFAVLIAIVVALPAVARGQVTILTGPSLAPGDTLRVRGQVGTRSRADGSLVRLDERGLTVKEFGRIATPATFIPLDSIHRVRVRRGTHRSIGQAVVGTAIGIAAGVYIGTVVGSKLTCADRCTKEDNWDGFIGAVVGAPIGGLFGGAVGMSIGARKQTRWIDVTIRRPAVLP